MPFDGTELFENSSVAKLGAVERLLATEQQWCKGRLRDAHGRHCLVGAIEAVEGRQVLQRVILHAAREVSGKRYWRIEFFNDDPRTTHADVLQVLRRAREKLIGGMICEGNPQPRHQRWMRGPRAFWSLTSDTGAAPRSEECGNRPLADEPAVLPRSLRAYVCADRGVRKERAVVMEFQD